MHRYFIPLIAVLAIGCADAARTLAPESAVPGGTPAFTAQHIEQHNAREVWTNVQLGGLQYTCSPPAEFLSFTGIMHTVSKILVDGSGVQRWTFHSHPIQAKVVGMTTGREFRIVGAENTTTQFFVDGTRHFHQTALLKLIPRSGPTFTIKVLVDRTGPPPTFKINRFEVECR